MHVDDVDDVDTLWAMPGYYHGRRGHYLVLARRGQHFVVFESRSYVRELSGPTTLREAQARCVMFAKQQREG